MTTPFLPRVAFSDQIGLTDAERKQTKDLATAWINDRLAPALGLFATVEAFAPTDPVPPECWPISLFHHETVDGALGHHDEDAKAGRPFGIVAVDDSGPRWRKTAMHELGELLKNPLVSACQLVGTLLLANEPCDAVEEDVDPADPDYSNIVLDTYYDPDFVGKVDFLGTLLGPAQPGQKPPLTVGGYVSYLDLNNLKMGWQQFEGPLARAERKVIQPWSRRGRLRSKHASRLGLIL